MWTRRLGREWTKPQDKFNENRFSSGPDWNPLPSAYKARPLAVCTTRPSFCDSTEPIGGHTQPAATSISLFESCYCNTPLRSVGESLSDHTAAHHTVQCCREHQTQAALRIAVKSQTFIREEIKIRGIYTSVQCSVFSVQCSVFSVQDSSPCTVCETSVHHKRPCPLLWMVGRYLSQ
jgi:hypothetical protein